MSMLTIVFLLAVLLILTRMLGWIYGDFASAKAIRRGEPRAIASSAQKKEAAYAVLMCAGVSTALLVGVFFVLWRIR